MRHHYSRIQHKSPVNGDRSGGGGVVFNPRTGAVKDLISVNQSVTLGLPNFLI